MNQKQFVSQIENTFKEALALVQRKNQDYATEASPFKNFEFSKLVGISVPRAILLRVVDKIARLENLIDKDSMSVKDESLQDTLIDIVNYMAIMKVYFDDKKQKKS